MPAVIAPTIAVGKFGRAEDDARAALENPVVKHAMMNMAEAYGNLITNIEYAERGVGGSVVFHNIERGRAACGTAKTNLMRTLKEQGNLGHRANDVCVVIEGHITQEALDKVEARLRKAVSDSFNGRTRKV